jgi:hypothetical protein
LQVMQEVNAATAEEAFGAPVISDVLPIAGATA